MVCQVKKPPLAHAFLVAGGNGESIPRHHRMLPPWVKIWTSLHFLEGCFLRFGLHLFRPLKGTWQMSERSEFCFRWIIGDPLPSPTLLKAIAYPWTWLLPNKELSQQFLYEPNLSPQNMFSPQNKHIRIPKAKLTRNQVAHSSAEEVFKTAILPFRKVHCPWEQGIGTQL